MINAPISRDTLSHAVEHAAPHLRPILRAVRDQRVGMLFVPQGPRAFRLPRDLKQAAIVIIGDDLDSAIGPEGFHLPSVRRVIRAAAFIAIVSSAPTDHVYGAMATAAAETGRNALIIETRLEQEIQWLSLVQKLAPKRPTILSTVQGGLA